MTQEKNTNFTIISLAIVTTLSTTAYILYSWIVLGYYFINSNGKLKYTQVILLIVFLIISGFILQQDKLVEIVFSKFSGGLSNRSFGDRFYSIIFNCEIIRQYPILGVGPEQFSLFQGQADYISAATNTILGTFSMYGLLPVFLLYILLFYYNEKSKNILGFICLVIVFIVMLSTRNDLFSSHKCSLLMGIKPQKTRTYC